MRRAERIRTKVAVHGPRTTESVPPEDQVSEDRLDLKKKPASAKRIKGVRMLNDVQFFGISGSQISSSMSGIKLEWNGDVVVVTCSSYPGQEKWLFPAGIQHIAWEPAE